MNAAVCLTFQVPSPTSGMLWPVPWRRRCGDAIGTPRLLWALFSDKPSAEREGRHASRIPEHGHKLVRKGIHSAAFPKGAKGRARSSARASLSRLGAPCRLTPGLCPPWAQRAMEPQPGLSTVFDHLAARNLKGAFPFLEQRVIREYLPSVLRLLQDADDSYVSCE
jgi:hypothetical protein